MQTMCVVMQYKFTVDDNFHISTKSLQLNRVNTVGCWATSWLQTVLFSACT